MERNSHGGFTAVASALAASILIPLLGPSAFAQSTAHLARPQGARAVSNPSEVVAPWTRPREALGIAEPPSKIHDNLWKFISTLPTSAGSASAMAAVPASSPIFQVRPDGAIRIEITCDSWDDAARKTLESLGFELVGVVTRPYILVDGWMPPARIASLQDVGFVRSVINAIAPVAKSQIQADAIMGTATLRVSDATLDGRGVTVGVISDSSSLAARDQARAFTFGDGRAGLPDETHINVLQANTGTNEGTGMMEIVHAMAPGSNLAFYGPTTAVDMSTGIQALAGAGCKVIVDDLGYYSQPWFEKGTIEQTIDTVTGQDVVYATAAGNDAQGWYTGMYNGANVTIRDNNNNPITINANKFINHTTGGSDYFLPFIVGANRSATVYLQWDDPFTAAGDDYDLFITDANGRIVNGSQSPQTGTQAPFEFVSSPVPAANTTYYAVVRHKTGAVRRLKLVVAGANFDANFDTPGGSIYEHAGAASALSVAAISAFDSGQTHIESFSSQGPIELEYPTHTFRQKPDVSGIDDVTVSNAGGFEVFAGVKYRFTGTSAAAPSVAAVAAVLRSHRPSWGEAEVKAAIVASCTDKGAAGYDSVFGSGLVQAGPAVTTAEIIYVDPSATTAPYDGSSWAHAYQTLQAAMNTAVSGDQIWCKYSVYNLTPPFVLKPGVKLYGGFDGSENGPKDRTPRGSVGLSTLTGGGNVGSVVTVPASATDSTELDGFRITGGTGTDGGFGQAWGGGVYIKAGGWPYIVNCEITGNTAAYGGGVWAGSSQSIFDRDDIHDNAATVSGGGMYLGTGSILVRDCRLANNTAPSGAGAICVGTAGSVMACIITNNQATGKGGGLRLEGNCQDFLLNDTIAINTAASGAGVSIDSTSNPWVINCIVAENLDGIAADHSFTALNNDLWGNPNGDVNGEPNPTGANGNISADPQFVGSGNGWPADYFRVQPLSPVIDSGNGAYTGSQPADYAGNNRWLGPWPDMGAYEFVPPVIMYVKANGNDLNDGVTWATAKATVQYAIDVLPYTERGEVWVQAGTYPNTILTVPSNVRIYGGFAGNETDKRSRNVTANPVILDATGTTGAAVTIADYATDLTILDGLTIQGGSNPSYGGGIYIGLSGRPVIQNCVIRNNVSGLGGGGIFAAFSTAVLHANIITRNTTTGYGGGIFVNGGAPLVTNSTITGNTGGSFAGGLYLVSTNARVADNTIAVNRSAYGGGLFEEGGGAPIVVNNTIVENSGPNGGGAMYTRNDFVLVNNIIAFNTTGVQAEAAFTLANHNLYFGNTNGDVPGQSASGAGDVSADPRIVRDQFGNYQIQPSSPARNAGSNAPVATVDTDIDGQARIQQSTVDIGADESDGITTFLDVQPIVYVKAETDGGSDSNSGSSWAAAKATVQAAINNAAVVGGEIWVKHGTYATNATLSIGVSIFGGFAGTESARSQRPDPRLIPSILDGTGSGPVLSVPLSAAATIDGFTITNGSAPNGGGISVLSANPVIHNNVITRNTVTGYGGGIYVSAGAPIITNNTITGNTSGNFGGGLYLGGTSARVADNTVTRNTSAYGGGFFEEGGGAPVVANNTIVENAAPNGGGALYTRNDFVLANNILAYNTSGIQAEAAFTLANHNLYFGNTNGDYPAQPALGTGDVSADPQIVRDPYGNYHIQLTSPARNAGSNAVVLSPDTDIDGQARIQQTTVDIGADESDGVAAFIPVVNVFYVDPAGDDGKDGASWATAKRTLQGAINAASTLGGEIWAKQGTYATNATLSIGVSIYGGFAGTETARSQRFDPRLHPSVLDGGASGAVLSVPSGIASTTAIDGFTITNGSSGNGGGIYVLSASVVIRNNIVTRNTATGYGGGIYVTGDAPVISNNTVIGNASGTFAGGIYLGGTSARVADNTIARNSSAFGGGLFQEGAGAPVVVNNTIVENAGLNDGGAMYTRNDFVLANNIIAFNTTGVQGETAFTLANHNLYFGNTNGDLPGLPASGAGDVSADPQIVRDQYGNYHIQPTSPARNAGSNAVVLTGDTDIDGQPRIQQTTVDVGADESDGVTAFVDVEPIAFVKAATDGGSDANGGGSWSAAKATLEGALAVLPLGGEVWVKQGTYTEHGVTLPIARSFYGGFVGSEAARNQRPDPRLHPSILDGGATGSVLVVLAGVTSTSVIDGFTIRNGAASPDGGGIRVVSASPVISNNTITGNTAPGNGGGIDVSAGSPTIRYNTISGNSAGGNGGGIDLLGAANPVVTNNVINGNHATTYGGGLMSNTTGGRIANNAVTNNANDGNYGAGISLFSANTVVTNNTIAYNLNSDGIRVFNGGNPVIANNIVAFNQTGVNADSQTWAFRNNDVYGNVTADYVSMTPPPAPDTANHNLSANPAFISSTNVRIAANSPCRDAGSDPDAFGPLDLDGAARIQGGHVDIGAYEASGPALYTVTDAARALAIAGGLVAASSADITHLNVEPGSPASNRITVADAIRIARKAAGRDANP